MLNLETYLKKYDALKNIKRFNMETVTEPQNLCDHGYNVANIFCLICQDLKHPVRLEEIFTVLNHDFIEVYTGDLNRAVKDKNYETKEAWKILENESAPSSLKTWTDSEMGLRFFSEKSYEIFQLADELDGVLYSAREVRKGNSYMKNPLELYLKKVFRRLGRQEYLSQLKDLHLVLEQIGEIL